MVNIKVDMILTIS